jgi:hypothetical protein
MEAFYNLFVLVFSYAQSLIVSTVSFRCSTIVELLPPPPLPSSSYEPERKLQKMQILIGAPLKRASTQQINSSFIASGLVIGEGFTGSDADSPHSSLSIQNGLFGETENCPVESLREVIVHCTSDFMTVSKEVSIRLRRVRLLGLKVLMKSI